MAYLGLGDIEQAKTWRDRSVALATERFVPDLVVALHVYRGEKDAALEYARKDLVSSPDSIRSLQLIRDHGIREGSFGETRDRFEQAHPELFDESTLNITWRNRAAAVELAYLLLQAGERTLAERLLERSLASSGSDSGMPGNDKSFLEARIHAVRGDLSQALTALRRAVEQGWRWYAWYYLEYDLLFQPLHDEPEFQTLKAVVENDLAEQLARVREWEASGDLTAVPGH
jgi:tetratricopeptide (TPR) repeat protein